MPPKSKKKPATASKKKPATASKKKPATASKKKPATASKKKPAAPRSSSKKKPAPRSSLKKTVAGGSKKKRVSIKKESDDESKRAPSTKKPRGSSKSQKKELSDNASVKTLQAANLSAIFANLTATQRELMLKQMTAANHRDNDGQRSALSKSATACMRNSAKRLARGGAKPTGWTVFLKVYHDRVSLDKAYGADALPTITREASKVWQGLSDKQRAIFSNSASSQKLTERQKAILDADIGEVLENYKAASKDGSEDAAFFKRNISEAEENRKKKRGKRGKDDPPKRKLEGTPLSVAEKAAAKANLQSDNFRLAPPKKKGGSSKGKRGGASAKKPARASAKKPAKKASVGKASAKKASAKKASAKKASAKKASRAESSDEAPATRARPSLKNMPIRKRPVAEEPAAPKASAKRERPSLKRMPIRQRPT